MNRRAVLGAALAPPCRSPAARARGAAGNLDLSRYSAGPLPPELLTSRRTGKGAASDSRVVEDAAASRDKATAQVSADATGYRVPLAAYRPLPAQDVEVSVRFKTASGKGNGCAVDQGRLGHALRPPANPTARVNGRNNEKLGDAHG